MALPERMTCPAILAELKRLGKESHRSTYVRHGAPPESIFGVPISDLKPFQKAIKKDYQLALALYATGNTDAMYLAGLIADETRMTRTDFNRWAREATWGMIHTSVASVAAESPHAPALASRWINAKKESIAAIGWATLSGFVSITPDDRLDIRGLEELLWRVVAAIHSERNEVKYTMNGFVIAAGCCVAPLHASALLAARKIGKVDVDMGPTACKVPGAEETLRKVAAMGRVGRKRKSARC